MGRNVTYNCDRCGEVIPEMQMTSGGTISYMEKKEPRCLVEKGTNHYLCDECYSEFKDFVKDKENER